MNLNRLACILGTTAAAAGLGAVAATSGAAPAETAAVKKITRKGVGAVKLKATYRSLRRKRLVGKLRQGCELAGPTARSAKLRKPLSGRVEFFGRKRPRRVRNIMVLGGGAARGVGIGDTLPDIKDAYPKAKVDRSTEDVFHVTLVKVPRDGGGRLQFAVATHTDRITAIGIPYISFCE